MYISMGGIYPSNCNLQLIDRPSSCHHTVEAIIIIWFSSSHLYCTDAEKLRFILRASTSRALIQGRRNCIWMLDVMAKKSEVISGRNEISIQLPSSHLFLPNIFQICLFQGQQGMHVQKNKWESQRVIVQTGILLGCKTWPTLSELTFVTH